MGYLNNSGLARFWNAIKSKFIRTINGIGPDANGNVSVDTCEFINGTQTAATGSFTGVSRDSSLYDGKHIIYRLPYAGSGNATLNLTLANGTTTGAKNVWRAPGTRLTTHYGAGNFLGMTYFQSDDSWHCDVDVDTGLPTGGSIGQVLAKKSATNYDVEWISPPKGVKIYNITYNSSTHTYALPDTFANVRSQFLAGNLVILSNNGLMYYLSEASASVLVFTTAVTDDRFVYRIEWQSSDTAINEAMEISLYNNYVPSGGTTGQFLVKKSNTNFDLQWVTVPNANGVSF